MSTPNDGGPAYPQPFGMGEYRIKDGNVTSVLAGMTLRDYFAAAALTGLSADQGLDYLKSVSNANERRAMRAYELADAMLKERATK